MVFKKMQDELLLCKLSDYFSVKDRINRIMPIIQKKSNITLTLLDWFVANYTKYITVEYEYNNRLIDVNREYTLQLREYTKKMSDPFCRDGKFNFYYTEEDYIETSVKQLCFFRWALTCGIIEYVEQNIAKLLKVYRLFKKNGTKAFIEHKNKAKRKHTKKNKKTEMIQTYGDIKIDW